MGQKTQTLIIFPNGDVAKRIDDFLYTPTIPLILDDKVWYDLDVHDEFDCGDWLVRIIKLKK